MWVRCNPCRFCSIDGGPSGAMVCTHPGIKGCYESYIISWRRNPDLGYLEKMSDQCPMLTRKLATVVVECVRLASGRLVRKQKEQP